jgi:hypothetical protein
MEWLCLLYGLVERFFTSDWFKGTPGGILTGAALLVAKDWYERHQARKRLVLALNTEAASAAYSINDLLTRFPTRAEASRLVKAVFAEQPALDFKTLDELPSGWLLFAPTFPLAEVITRLTPKEAHATIDYLDAWARVTEFERRYAVVYWKFVEGTSKLDDAKHRLQLQECACQVRGCLRQLFVAAKQLSVARHDLERATARSLSWNPLVIFSKPAASEQEKLDYPKDWDAPPEPDA